MAFWKKNSDDEKEEKDRIIKEQQEEIDRLESESEWQNDIIITQDTLFRKQRILDEEIHQEEIEEMKKPSTNGYGKKR